MVSLSEQVLELSVATVVEIQLTTSNHQTTDLMVEGVVRDGEWMLKMSW
jgi:hypothetical protein